MRKICAIILTALMLVMMAVPVFAGQTQEADFQKIAFEVKKANTAWKADGVYSEGEYYDIALQSSWISAAYNDDANEAMLMDINGLGLKLAMSWDENYIYLYSQYVAPFGHSNTWDSDPGSMWYSGAMQLNYAEADGVDEDRLEYGIGKSSDTGDLLTYDWADYLGSGYDALANGDFYITVDGSTVTYECRTPISAFSAVAAAEGVSYGVCYVWSVGVDQDYAHTQLASGCTGFGKHADYFAKMTLAAAPEIVTEAPETEAPVEDTAAVETPAAQTADIVAVAAVVAIISLAGVAISKKH